MATRIPIPPAAERRIRREARSAAFPERALALREAGWTLAEIGGALGVCPSRVFQIIRKAARLRRLISSPHEEGAPATERPGSNSPLQTGRNNGEHPCLYPLLPT